MLLVCILLIIFCISGEELNKKNQALEKEYIVIKFLSKNNNNEFIIEDLIDKLNLSKEELLFILNNLNEQLYVNKKSIIVHIKDNNYKEINFYSISKLGYEYAQKTFLI